MNGEGGILMTKIYVHVFVGKTLLSIHHSMHFGWGPQEDEVSPTLFGQVGAV